MAASQRHLQASVTPAERPVDGVHGSSNGTEHKRFGLGDPSDVRGYTDSAQGQTDSVKGQADSLRGHVDSVKGQGKDVSTPSPGVSVTVLTLDTASKHNDNNNSNTTIHSQPVWSVDRDLNMAELKYVRDFQVRKKYGRRSSFQTPRREKSLIELGLLGTKYFDNKTDNSNNADNNGNNPSPTSNSSNNSNNNRPVNGEAVSPLKLNSPRLVKRSSTSILESRGTFILNESVAVSPSTERISQLGKTEDDRQSTDSTLKDLTSPLSTSFPPLSLTPRGGAKSENSFYPSRQGQSSLLASDYGFNTIRTDTFSGLKRQRRLKNGNIPENEELFRELEQHAQRQLLACQNMGYFHRGSRAAENVLSLKETLSPNAFHPPAFFTRHLPKTDDRAASRGGDEDNRRSCRKLTHPSPAGKLSVPRLLVQDRQDHATRRSTLPYVSGSSLQVMLAQTHAK